MRFLALTFAAFLAFLFWQYANQQPSAVPVALQAAPDAPRVLAATVNETPTPSPFAPVWIETQVMAEAVLVNLRLTEMSAGATGTAAYIAPTQAEDNRRGTATQQAIERAVSRTETQQSIINAGTATQQARTQTQFAVDVARANQTATMFPAFQRAAAGTAYAEATLAADSLKQERVKADAVTWAFVGGVLAIPVSILIAVYMVTAALTDRVAAETRARAQRIANGTPRPTGERSPAPEVEPRGSIARNVGDLEMLDSDARRVVDYLQALLETTSPDVTILPGRSVAGAGGEKQRAVYEWLEKRELLARAAGENCRITYPLGELVELVASGKV